VIAIIEKAGPSKNKVKNIKKFVKAVKKLSLKLND
jgi:hypothetical protein